MFPRAAVAETARFQVMRQMRRRFPEHQHVGPAPEARDARRISRIWLVVLVYAAVSLSGCGTIITKISSVLSRRFV